MAVRTNLGSEVGQHIVVLCGVERVWRVHANMSFLDFWQFLVYVQVAISHPNIGCNRVRSDAVHCKPDIPSKNRFTLTAYFGPDRFRRHRQCIRIVLKSAVCWRVVVRARPTTQETPPTPYECPTFEQVRDWRVIRAHCNALSLKRIK